MNRKLLAGCAAVALVLGCGAAGAQTKFDLKIGGDVYVEGGYVSQDQDAGLRSTEMRNRLRVSFVPTAKADNGLEYGARLRIRAFNNQGSPTATSANGRTIDTDRAFVFVGGGFGQFRIGVTNSYSDESYVTAPEDYNPLGIFDGVAAWLGNSNFTTGGLATLNGSEFGQQLAPDNLSTKIVYFSPRFAGLQIGASYEPRNDSSNTDVNRVKPTITALSTGFTNAFTDLAEVGANYANSFGDIKLRASAAYFHGAAADTAIAGAKAKDMNAVQLGAQIGYAGFTIGGAYVDYGESGQIQTATSSNDRSRLWTAGVQYTTGPIVVGVNYKNAQDAGNLYVAGKRTLEAYEAGAGYTVAPGLMLQAQYDHFKGKSDLTTATVNRDDEGDVVLLRTVLEF